MFTDTQKAALEAPLNPKHVADRQQGGGKVQYIEGWHAIAEANRIFGFDSWTRETVDIRQLGEAILGQDKYGKDQWRVNYMSRVRIIVNTADGIFPIIREGCGFGQGIDKDVGQAHESALKEAETDAMKRALMTFGNPFGLALYDKSRANVQAPAEPVIDDAQFAQLATLVEQTATDTTAMLEHYGVKALNQLTVQQWRAAVATLTKRLPKKDAA